MATKKRAKKKSAKKPGNQPRNPRRKTKQRAPKKKAQVKSNLASKKSARKTKPITKKGSRPGKGFAGKPDTAESIVFEPAGLGARSGGQSGDLQGLSDRDRANSESVDELLEEGNSFEAEIIKGVEDADDADEKEVYTHEVPEDDVPGEYLDKD